MEGEEYSADNRIDDEHDLEHQDRRKKDVGERRLAPSSGPPSGPWCGRTTGRSSTAVISTRLAPLPPSMPDGRRSLPACRVRQILVAHVGRCSDDCAAD